MRAASCTSLLHIGVYPAELRRRGVFRTALAARRPGLWGALYVFCLRLQPRFFGRGFPARLGPLTPGRQPSPRFFVFSS